MRLTATQSGNIFDDLVCCGDFPGQVLAIAVPTPRDGAANELSDSRLPHSTRVHPIAPKECLGDLAVVLGRVNVVHICKLEKVSVVSKHKMIRLTSPCLVESKAIVKMVLPFLV